ncbi:hypothetical protein GPECTOR_54g192 [Gonium pectorale]|uniref:Uncharacterized protein n=1 Tax=Gonium pectorale TaxID=33097 RepID=A0A150G6K1_GONPE|nr:hypothetical protein GPECTOR_54g192 [Gonium pectorale]|eukprot:KXZ45451.1 hypothetical protein GPECTOR_54g192 [Gonium pectorale]
MEAASDEDGSDHEGADAFDDAVSLQQLQSDTITNDKNMKHPEKQRILSQISSEIACVLANPDHTIDTRLDEIRQAKYKLKVRARGGPGEEAACDCKVR